MCWEERGMVVVERGRGGGVLEGGVVFVCQGAGYRKGREWWWRGRRFVAGEAILI